MDEHDRSFLQTLEKSKLHLPSSPPHKEIPKPIEGISSIDIVVIGHGIFRGIVRGHIASTHTRADQDFNPWIVSQSICECLLHCNIRMLGIIPTCLESITAAAIISEDLMCYLPLCDGLSGKWQEIHVIRKPEERHPPATGTKKIERTIAMFFERTVQRMKLIPRSDLLSNIYT
jgi:hypothetical protein